MQPSARVSPTSSSGPATSRLGEAWIWGALWAFVVAILSIWLRGARWGLSGHDAFFHLAVARYLGDQGLLSESVPWLRKSLLAHSWGDKELLFHWWLAPFVGHDPVRSGQVALGVLNGTLAGLLALLGVRWVGRRGALLPLVTMATSWWFLVRCDYLRPHQISLILLLIAVYLVGRGRYRWLAPLGFLYALSYTAWQTLIVLSVLIWIALRLLGRDPSWRLLAYPALGIGFGVLLHPHFPNNLVVWAVQNIEFYRLGAETAAMIGTEIYPLTVPDFLGMWLPGLVVAVVALGCVGAWRARRPASEAEISLAVAALAFVALSALAQRFIEYSAPFAAAWGLLIFSRYREGSRPRAASRLLVALAILLAAGWNVSRLAAHQDALLATLGFSSPEDAERFGRALPPGARVAAFWDDAPAYILAAPQAVYLNVLDPIFMLLEDPGAYRRMRALADSRVLDVPPMLSGYFDSEYLALKKDTSRALIARLERDPRVARIEDLPRHVLFRLTPGEYGFVTSWEIRAGSGDEGRVWSAERLGGGEFAPALVVAPPEIGGPCWRATRRVQAPALGRRLRVGLGAAGPLRVELNGETRFGLTDPGEGWIDSALIVLELPAGENEISVRTCGGKSGSGFFWREQES